MSLTATMTNSLRRRSLIALPLLLVPVLMTACSSPSASPSSSSAASSGSTTSATSASTSAAGAGTDLYKKYATSAKFCALVSPADVAAAMQTKPAYPAPKLASSPVECSYANSDVHSIVSVEWSPKGGGLLDDYLEASPKEKPATIDVDGHAGRSLNGGVQVVVGDAAIDVFGLPSANLSHEAAVAAAFLKKVG